MNGGSGDSSGPGSGRGRGAGSIRAIPDNWPIASGVVLVPPSSD